MIERDSLFLGTPASIDLKEICHPLELLRPFITKRLPELLHSRRAIKEVSHVTVFSRVKGITPSFKISPASGLSSATRSKRSPGEKISVSP
jgi:hypothetical protein